MDISLKDKLKNYNDKKTLRMHMPGHKGGEFEKIMPSRLTSQDITEISGFDNLFEAEGILRDSMDIASRVWKSKKSFYLVNGSTCGLIASIRAMTKSSDRVLMSKRCHKSVFNAVELCNLEPVFFDVDYIEEWGIFGSCDPYRIEEKLKKDKSIRLCIITSPTYEGVISDLKSICKICHSYNVPCLVDEAHGAHLSFFGEENNAVSANADIAVQSLHKTLFAPTQSAICHVNGAFCDINELQRQLSVFETSSPSYLMMSSIDSLVREIYGNKNIFNTWKKALDAFYEKSRELKKLRILTNEASDFKSIYAYDRSKIFIGTQNIVETPSFLFNLFSERLNTELEMQGLKGVLAMTGMGDTKESLLSFFDILKNAENFLHEGKKTETDVYFTDSSMAMKPLKAVQSEKELCLLKESCGRISSDYIWAYPPGIPIVIPGEIITESIIEMIENFPLALHSFYSDLPEKIAVCSL